METEQLFFNGISGTTGEYLLPPLTPAKVSEMAQDETDKIDKAHLEVLKIRHIRDTEGQFGPVSWVEDPNNLAQAGWGVIFPADDKTKEVPTHKNRSLIKDALKELLEHRRNQAGDYYQEYTYYSPQTANEFLADHYATPSDPADPEKVPYYLLIVGDPEEIPFTFQYQLDVQYAVGRIYFDTLADYAYYARSVVEAETGKLFLPRQARFFGIWNEDDEATKQSTKHLVQPLAAWANTKLKSQNWDIQSILETEATKARLSQLLGGSETPALLFTASHGLAFEDTRKERHTGALLCQDWYRGYQGRIPEDWYFSADDISNDAKLLGLIAFHFACYGAGTPKEDEYGHRANNWKDIAARAFVAPLPKKLLSHPKGGALAVIGHIDRAWNQSFLWNLVDEKAGEQLSTFKSTLNCLMKGHRVGFALEEINKRYAALSTDLATIFQRKQRIGTLPDIEETKLVYKWTANNDARGYAIIGDPAVRLMVEENGTPQAERSTITEVIFSTPSTPATSEQFPTQKESLESAISQLASPTQPSVTIPSSGAFETESADTAFGLLDASRQARESLSQALTRFTTKLSTALQQAVDDTTSLEVSTYSSDNMAGVTYSVTSGKFEGTAKLQALTRIKFDGDTIICVPEKEGKVDETLWKIHADMVQQAQTHRAELLKVMVSTATSLLNALKVV